MTEDKVGLISLKSTSSTFTWVLQNIKTETFLNRNFRGQSSETRSPKIVDPYHRCEFHLEACCKYSDHYEPHGDYINLSIYLDGAENTAEILSKYHKIEFSIIDQRSKEVNTRECTGRFHNIGNQMEVTRFIQRESLFNKFFGLVPNNQLTLRCKVSVIESNHRARRDTLFRYNEMSYQDDVCENLEDIFKSKDFADVTIIAGGKKILAHKAILTARSPVFMTMFQCNMKEKKDSRVEINDMDSEVVNEMLYFMYTGKLKSIHKYAFDLLHAGNKYCIPTLMKECERYLGCSLSLENFTDALIFADFYGLTELKEKVYSFVKYHGQVIIDLKNFKDFEISHPCLAATIRSTISSCYTTVLEEFWTV